MEDRRGTRRLGRLRPRTALIWIAAVVVVLVAVDVVLVSLALGRTAPGDHREPGPIPTYTSTPAPTAPATPGASATPSASASAGSADAASGRRLLSAVDSREAWRASSTSCSAAQAVLEHSVDGGATWVTVPLAEDVRSVTGLRASAGSVSILAGVGKDCTPTVRTSADGGDTWIAGKAGAAGAGISGSSLQLATGSVDAPCADPVDAYQGQYTTVVACASEVQWRSGTGAWVGVPLTGILAIADAGSTYALARVGSSTCDGVEIVRLPATAVTSRTPVTPIGCWSDGGSAAPVAIDMAGTALWAWAGDETAVSGNGGASW
ncbi:hypothetical protein [Curtobacterium sp. 9128]|uniref:hypothetical protein n=1 Tax=Curtobacterium sp. 9128 TaxID=1793722 RepID=UPI0011A023DD|nr:hypothetical protein [Curtobacterium sp. 9128]